VRSQILGEHDKVLDERPRGRRRSGQQRNATAARDITSAVLARARYPRQPVLPRNQTLWQPAAGWSHAAAGARRRALNTSALSAALTRAFGDSDGGARRHGGASGSRQVAIFQSMRWRCGATGRRREYVPAPALFSAPLSPSSCAKGTKSSAGRWTRRAASQT